MSKLPKQDKFIDLSDYGRPVARWIAESLKGTALTPVHVTIGFIIAGFLAIYCMLQGWYWGVAFFLVLKSILDAADGELARVKQTPSYTGRYLDSVADIILNLFFIITIWHITDGSILYSIMAFFGIQLQGTLYNYYYVILRNKVNGDKTSRVFEDHTPKAMDGESQTSVNILYGMYNCLYIVFDKAIYYIDRDAIDSKVFPKWFMTAVSSFGLGFQLLIIGVMFILGLATWIIPFFIGYTFLILIFVLIRRYLNSV